MDRTVILRNIKTINGNRTKLVALIGETALACIEHAHLHGDVTLADKLVDAVGAGMKRESLRIYMCKFGPMNPASAEKQKEGHSFTFAKTKRVEGEALAERMAAAAEEPWHAANTEKKAEDWTFDAALGSLMKRLTKQCTEQGYTPSAKEQRVIDAVRRAIAEGEGVTNG